MVNNSYYEPEKLEEYAKVYKETATNIARTCDCLFISRKTWYNWRKEHKDFSDRMSEVEESMKDFVESQLYKNIKSGKETSCMFYLQNKRPDTWKDKRFHEHSGTMNLIEVDK